MPDKKRKVGDAVLAALDEARTELDEREAKLEEREEALRKAVEGVDHEKKLMAGRKPSDVLPLNIGGTRCHVSRKTLCQFEKSMLAAQFSGRWDDSIEKDADGFFFIDQPHQLMLPLINFLRAKAIETPALPALPFPKEYVSETERQHLLSAFHRVVEHYGMTPFVYQQHFCFRGGLRREGEIACGPEPAISCAAWTTFSLEPVHHDLHVKSFEVVFDSIERLQIGWTHKGQLGAVEAADHKGPAQLPHSIALDCDRLGVFLSNASVVKFSELSIKAGSVVTCERAQGTPRRITWLVDGATVATVSGSPTVPGSTLADLSNLDASQVYPTISGKGQWRVTQFTYF